MLDFNYSIRFNPNDTVTVIIHTNGSYKVATPIPFKKISHSLASPGDREYKLYLNQGGASDVEFTFDGTLGSGTIITHDQHQHKIYFTGIDESGRSRGSSGAILAHDSTGG